MPKGLAGPAAAADAEVEVNQDKSKKPVDASLPKEATNPKDNLEEPKKVEQVEMQNISGKDVRFIQWSWLLKQEIKLIVIN